jgi:AcrR family transcriptional regulator
MQRVVGAAIDCFAEFGFHGTTVRILGERADLSQGAIYLNFSSKVEILDFIIFEAHKELLSDMTRIVKFDSSANRLSFLVKAHVRWHALRKTAARIANDEFFSLPRSKRLRIKRVRDLIGGLFVEAIEEGVASGEFDVDDVHPLVLGIISMGLGVTRWFKYGGRLSPDDLADLYARAVLSMVQAHS